MTDHNLRPLILKLKDWPTSDDFKHILPTRFKDLMDNSPIAQYTNRESRLNLVSSLPDFFVKPDLGPKFYVAYGSLDLKKIDQVGTTNLHVDISDAFNIMMYVGTSVSKKTDSDIVDGLVTKWEFKKIKKTMFNFENLVSFEKAQYDRYLNGEQPGALWHLFRPHDADIIRQFLKDVGSFF